MSLTPVYDEQSPFPSTNGADDAWGMERLLTNVFNLTHKILYNTRQAPRNLFLSVAPLDFHTLYSQNGQPTAVSSTTNIFNVSAVHNTFSMNQLLTYPVLNAYTDAQQYCTFPTEYDGLTLPFRIVGLSREVRTGNTPLGAQAETFFGVEFLEQSDDEALRVAAYTTFVNAYNLKHSTTFTPADFEIALTCRVLVDPTVGLEQCATIQSWRRQVDPATAATFIAPRLDMVLFEYHHSEDEDVFNSFSTITLEGTEFINSTIHAAYADPIDVCTMLLEDATRIVLNISEEQEQEQEDDVNEDERHAQNAFTVYKTLIKENRHQMQDFFSEGTKRFLLEFPNIPHPPIFSTGLNTETADYSRTYFAGLQRTNRNDLDPQRGSPLSLTAIQDGLLLWSNDGEHKLTIWNYNPFPLLDKNNDSTNNHNNKVEITMPRIAVDLINYGTNPNPVAQGIRPIFAQFIRPNIPVLTCREAIWPVFSTQFLRFDLLIPAHLDWVTHQLKHNTTVQAACLNIYEQTQEETLLDWEVFANATTAAMNNNALWTQHGIFPVVRYDFSLSSYLQGAPTKFVHSATSTASNGAYHYEDRTIGRTMGRFHTTFPAVYSFWDSDATFLRPRGIVITNSNELMNHLVDHISLDVNRNCPTTYTPSLPWEKLTAPWQGQHPALPATQDPHEALPIYLYKALGDEEVSRHVHRGSTGLATYFSPNLHAAEVTLATHTTISPAEHTVRFALALSFENLLGNSMTFSSWLVLRNWLTGLTITSLTRQSSATTIGSFESSLSFADQDPLGNVVPLGTVQHLAERNELFPPAGLPPQTTMRLTLTSPHVTWDVTATREALLTAHPDLPKTTRSRGLMQRALSGPNAWLQVHVVSATVLEVTNTNPDHVIPINTEWWHLTPHVIMNEASMLDLFNSATLNNTTGFNVATPTLNIVLSLHQTIPNHIGYEEVQDAVEIALPELSWDPSATGPW